VSVIRNVHWQRGHRFAIPLMAALLMLAATTVRAQDATLADPAQVRVVSDTAGARLQVGGRDFMVYGMNWDYVPIGENYLYSLWQQPDDLIEAALAREMPLLKNMGVNAMRQYVGIPPRWVRYIYERYGIYTVINHPCARYGYTLDGAWIPNVDYADPRLRAALIAEVSALVEEFQGVPGVLMWLLGNENNYGLSWTSFEAEALPQDERDAARAHQLYSLFGEIIAAVKSRDTDRPVAIANGDLQYIDVIAQDCRGLDVFGTNVYRGISARDLFQVVKDKLGVPVMRISVASAWLRSIAAEISGSSMSFLRRPTSRPTVAAISITLLSLTTPVVVIIALWNARYLPCLTAASAARAANVEFGPRIGHSL